MNLGVLDAALNVLSHSVTAFAPNQTYVRELNGFATLSKLFGKVVEEAKNSRSISVGKKPGASTESQEKLLLAVLENLCLCLSNMCFHNSQNQEMLLKQGIINQVIGVLLTEGEQPLWWLTSEIVQQMVFLLVNATDTNAQVQEYLLISVKDKLMALINKYLLTENPTIAGYTALWISHISFNSKMAQELLVTPRYVQRLLQLTDYKTLLAGPTKPDSEEIAQQISFFALLAVINLSYSHAVAQELIFDKSGLKLLCGLLSDPTFEPKKTVCFALSNVIRDNEKTQQALLQLDG